MKRKKKIQDCKQQKKEIWFGFLIQFFFFEIKGEASKWSKKKKKD